MKLGFGFRETMRGTYYLLRAPTDERPMQFTLAARADSLKQFARDKLTHIEGEVTLEGFADARPLEGTLALRMLDQRRLPYDFTFTGNDGRPYRFRGQKDMNVLSPVQSLTVLPATVYDEAGEEVARANVRFDLRGDLEKFIRSFRMKLR